LHRSASSIIYLLIVNPTEAVLRIEGSFENSDLAIIPKGPRKYGTGRIRKKDIIKRNRLAKGK
jgi:hypothetical protein